MYVRGGRVSGASGRVAIARAMLKFAMACGWKVRPNWPKSMLRSGTGSPGLGWGRWPITCGGGTRLTTHQSSMSCKIECIPAPRVMVVREVRWGVLRSPSRCIQASIAVNVSRMNWMNELPCW